MKGYRKINFALNGKRPICFNILKQLYETTSLVCFISYEALLFNTAFVLAYFGPFCVSELLPASIRSPLGMLSEHVLVEQEPVFVAIKILSDRLLRMGYFICM